MKLIVVIDSKFVYHFFDPDLRAEIVFRKEGTTESGGIDFEIGDIGTSVHSCRACLLFYYFFGDNK